MDRLDDVPAESVALSPSTGTSRLNAACWDIGWTYDRVGGRRSTALSYGM